MRPDIRWMAGVLDSDGSIFCTAQGRWGVNVTSKVRTICEAFEERFGGTVSEYSREGRTCWVWQLSNRELLGEAMSALGPHLQLKTLKAYAALEGVS